MQNITIRRFQDSDHYALIIEPADHMWQLKVQQDGTPRFFLAEKETYPATATGVYDESVSRPDACYHYRECAEMGYLRRVAWSLGKPPKANDPDKLVWELVEAEQAEKRSLYEEISASSGAVCALVAVLKARGLSTEGAVNELAARVVSLLPPVEDRQRAAA